MTCRTSPFTDNPEAGQDFPWTRSFVNDTEVAFETHAKPGDYVDQGFRYNNDRDSM